MKVQAFGLGGREHRGKSLFRNARRIEGNHGQTFARGEFRQKLRQLALADGGVQNLIRRIVVDFGVAAPGGPVLFVQVIVEIPGAVDQIGDAARDCADSPAV